MVSGPSLGTGKLADYIFKWSDTSPAENSEKAGEADQVTTRDDPKTSTSKSACAYVFLPHGSLLL